MLILLALQFETNQSINHSAARKIITLTVPTIANSTHFTKKHGSSHRSKQWKVTKYVFDFIIIQAVNYPLAEICIILESFLQYSKVHLMLPAPLFTSDGSHKQSWLPGILLAYQSLLSIPSKVSPEKLPFFSSFLQVTPL